MISDYSSVIMYGVKTSIDFCPNSGSALAMHYLNRPTCTTPSESSIHTSCVFNIGSVRVLVKRFDNLIVAVVSCAESLQRLR